MQEQNGTYKYSCSNKVEGPITPELLKKALQCIMKRHPQMRYSYGPKRADGELYFHEVINDQEVRV
jgi:hypothetical protein